MAILDTKTECLSGARYGELAEINGTAWNSQTTVHNITASGVIDCVFLHVFNVYTASVDLQLVLNPDDSSTQASVDASTATISIPAESDVWILQGDRFRKHGSGNNTLTIGAYVTSGSEGRLRFSGHVDRLTQAEENPL